MKRMSLEKEDVHVDYTTENIPDSVKNFRPTVFRDGDEYCCILGTEEAVVGTGNTVEEAMNDWDRAYQMKVHK
ncbi:hypothetical protein [Chitinophaga tropicalis]|uniref:Uncharacterized protein n=1 Tax=Chitinophaga tropicalis TaxID=2683588 RepID=A0A7K1U2B7_9BACT|nr:hypothetical protein [Chitinophaga tropicalis]MVT08493.1 hypothetical protein [Chitinophaga tropicalis]